MQIAAMTSHAALTASPRLSATIANATAPRRATAIHKTFACGALELLTVLMGDPPAQQEPPQNKFHPRADLDQEKTVLATKKNTSPQCRRREKDVHVARDVRFWANSGHMRYTSLCPLYP